MQAFITYKEFMTRNEKTKYDKNISLRINHHIKMLLQFMLFFTSNLTVKLF